MTYILLLYASAYSFICFIIASNPFARVGDRFSRNPKMCIRDSSYGERLSSEIVCGAVAGSVRYDAREFIKTKPLFNRHVVDFASTEKLIERRFERCV